MVARTSRPRLWALALTLLGAAGGLAVPVGVAHGITPVATDGTPSFTTLWRTPLGKLPSLAWKPRAPATPTLTADALGVVFAGRHGVSLLRAETGAQLWQVKTADAVEGAVVERDGVIYAATADGGVLALDRRSGRARWPATQLRAAVHAGVSVDARHVYVVADPGTVHAVSRKSGKVVWRRRALSSREFLVEGHGSATVVGSVVVAGTSDGRLLGLHTRDGAVAWQTRLGGRTSKYTDVDATPVRLGSDLLVASAHNAGVFAVGVRDGAKRWRYAVTGARQPHVYRDVVYVVAGDVALHAVTASGKRAWARKLVGDPSGALSFLGDRVFIPGDGGLVLARLSDGQSLTRLNDGYGFAGAPLVTAGQIFALSNAGIAYRLLVSP